MQAETALIWNPIVRQYLVNAPHRMNRREGTATCPFCGDITSGRVDPQTQVWLHPNDFPPLQPPIGEAYVVIYSRAHDRTFTQLSVDEVNAVTHLWRDLYTDLATRYATVMIFENSSESIGQTQHHPHGQAYGVSIIPPTLEREMETVVQDDAAGRGCPFCRVRAELSDDVSEVAANTTWQAFLVSTPELDTFVELARQSGALGARLTGAGFGGCASALIEREDAEALAQSVQHHFEARGFKQPVFYSFQPAAGAEVAK